MINRIKDEKELLNAEVRRRIIEEIKGPENLRRKEEKYKRYMIYKDHVRDYVIKELIKQFKQETVEQMSYASSNINITKKIIDKLARVYSYGVKRDAGPNTENVEAVAKALKLNQKMKKTNRYTELQRNIAVQICPSPVTVNNTTKYEIQARVLQPYFYDVVENFYDHEKPMAYITSSFRPSGESGPAVSLVPATEARTVTTPQLTPQGDGKDQIIADSPADQGANQELYVWWSRSYHFTTNAYGEYVSTDTKFDRNNPANPINRLPFVEFAIDQDGNFWALGGNDITDGTVLVNSMITNVNHIGVVQGYGQLWMKGKGLPKNITVGPTNAIQLEYTKEDPEPDLGFATSNPPLDELKGQIEMYIALLLTTNNLSTSGVSAQLQGGGNFAAGIALMIDKAESLEDVEDQRQIFLDGEPEIFKIYADWYSVYSGKNLLTDEFKQLPLSKDIELTLKFGDPRPIMSEAEKLDNIAKRKELGINRMIELILMDDPSLSEEQAEEKLKLILEENMERLAKAVNEASGNGQNGENEDESIQNEKMMEDDTNESDGDEGEQ